MIVYEASAVFRDRVDAGKQLAEKLLQYSGGKAIVLALPRGGVPVAIEVAERLDLPLDVVVPHKLPVPYNTGAGYGAVNEDGGIVLNELLVEQLRLPRQQIEQQVKEVHTEIVRRAAAYRGNQPFPPLEGKTAIIVDDGLASGFTMLAAIKSVKWRKVARTVVAVPVASGNAYDRVRVFADEVECLAIARLYPFAVAGFYENWYDLTDEEVINYLTGWRKKHSHSSFMV